MRSIPHRSTHARLLPAVYLLTTLLMAACGDETAPEGLIDRETFVATYVDLRVAALESESGELSDADREAVLSSHGVSSDDLLAFADYYGTDLETMREVWNEVEERLDIERPTQETPADPG